MQPRAEVRSVACAHGGSGEGGRRMQSRGRGDRIAVPPARLAAPEPTGTSRDRGETAA